MRPFLIGESTHGRLTEFLRFIPIAVVVAGILFLTTQNISDNAKLSEGLRGWLISLYERLDLDSSDAWWNDKLAVRRLGHILEYGVLGIASGIALIDLDSHRVNSILKAIGLCLLISVLDQTVKIFVPVRHFDIVDIGFDMVGAVAGILIVTAVGRLVKKS